MYGYLSILILNHTHLHSLLLIHFYSPCTHIYSSPAYIIHSPIPTLYLQFIHPPATHNRELNHISQPNIRPYTPTPKIKVKPWLKLFQTAASWKAAYNKSCYLRKLCLSIWAWIFQYVLQDGYSSQESEQYRHIMYSYIVFLIQLFKIWFCFIVTLSLK